MDENTWRNMDNLPHITLTRQLPADFLAPLEGRCTLEIWPEPLPPPHEELRAMAARSDGMMVMLTDRIDRDLLAAAPRLRVVSVMAVGVDAIDLAAATEHGVAVGHTPGILTETTADLAFALLLAAARRLPEAQRTIPQGGWRTWEPVALTGLDVYGATLGIVGMGRIGRAVARRAAGFDMRVLYHGGDPLADPERPIQAEARSLDALLRESDFVSLNVPLTADTRGLIGARELGLMQPHAMLINTSRGTVVDQDALLDALQRRRIAAAALDVTDPEPLPRDHPLLSLDNCLVVPHIGSATVATRRRMAHMVIENLLAGLAGERLPYCANPALYG
jgi:glyoxylate reductase